MAKFNINITTSSQINSALLLTGVPFAKGVLQPGQGLALKNGEKQLPLWWKPTSYWPDGSIKWIFMHGRVPAGKCDLQLVQGDVSGQSEGFVQKGKDSFSLSGNELWICQDRWRFATPKGSWELKEDVTQTNLENASTEFACELLEDSPIAPLIRIQQQTDIGLLKDQLLRLDPEANRLIWQRRMTWNRPGQFELKNAEIQLHCSAADASSAASLKMLAHGQTEINGEAHSATFPQALLESGRSALWLEKAWQRYPFSMEWSGADARLSLYPADAVPLGITGGTSYRHTVHLTCSEEPTTVAGHETEIVIDPRYLCATEVLGPLRAALTDEELKQQDPVFPGYELSFKQTLLQARLTRLDDAEHEQGPAAKLNDEAAQDMDYFGLQHYGDWPMPWHSYGSKGRRMYASNEYDPAYSFYQGYAIYGNWEFRQIARHSAIHMSDVDWISYNGDMRYHGYSEQAEDHQLARSPKGDFGHYWTDGYWLLYFLEGDIWAREAAQGVTRFLLDQFDQGGIPFMRKIWSIAERELGWPMVALMASYEAEGKAEVLDCISQIVRFIEGYTAAPDKELEEETGTAEYPIVWWRTAMQDGCKPFMVGIIMEGLERYHKTTSDVKAASALLRLASFITTRMWAPGRASFLYEWNAYGRKHRDIYSQELTPLFVRGIGYAYELTGEQQYREIAEKAFQACLWTLNHPETGGKSIAIIGRTLGAFAAMAETWLKQDELQRSLQHKPSSGESIQWEEGIASLLESGQLRLKSREPRWHNGGLQCDRESFVFGRLAQPVYTDCGRIELRLKLTGNEQGLNQHAYLHLSDEKPTQSCISLITFYDNLHVRLYDHQRELIEVGEASIVPDKLLDVVIEWEAPGELKFYIEGKLVDRRPLNRPLGGAFRNMHIGHKPGNWRLLGEVQLLSMQTGVKNIRNQS